MSQSKLGRTLVIANPAAQSGKGASGAEFVRRFLDSYSSATDGFEIRLTESQGDGTTMGRSATGFDTVVALGGDGIIHEVVNGLMKIDADLRPRLGIIPLGSGNDFARTLGVSINSPEQSLGELIQGTTRLIELGLVNGTYFMETLSWGVDAAIAIDTVERRKLHANDHGLRLWAGSGVDVIRKTSQEWHFHASIDGGEAIHGLDRCFAVQVGPTYGGGFRICPDASPADGLLNVCYSLGNPSTARMLVILAQARSGSHVKARIMHLCTATTLVVDFDEEPPCQVDGEKLEGTHFEVSVVPEALHVVVPQNCPW